MLYCRNIAVRVLQGVIRVLLKDLERDFGYKQVCTQLCREIYQAQSVFAAERDIAHWMIVCKSFTGVFGKEGGYMGYNIDVRLYEKHLRVVCILGNGEKAGRDYTLPIRTAYFLTKALQF